MTNKTTEALKLAEALENDAKEHREVSYGLDCPPERTANWQHALNCEAAARLIREALAEPVKQEPIGEVDPYMDFLRINWKDGRHPPKGTKLYAAPVQQVPIVQRNLELTDDEIVEVLEYYDHEWDETTFAIAAAIVTAIKEKQK